MSYSKKGSQKQELLLRIIILTLIYILAFCVRLFSVLRYESVIHEFDPYFNYRSTQFLVRNGFYKFFNWFDDESWYPLGRIIGGTMYPGLMITAAVLYWILNAINITIKIRNVCVLVAPFFASNTSLITYFLTSEIKNPKAGLLAAAMISIVPGYISRSVAGSFDYECVSICALLTTFYLFVKSVKTGSFYWSLLSCLGYFYMVNAWGGYIFITNIIPLYVLALMILGRYSHRLYVAYSTFFAVGTLLSMQVRFVNFKAVSTSEHYVAMGVFILIQIVNFLIWVRSLLEYKSFKKLFYMILLSLLGVIVLVLMTAKGGISGRLLLLLDPASAKQIAIVKSISEHQPTAWASFFFDLNILTILFPVGIYFCFQDFSESAIFIILYGMFSVYFSSIMVRLMLVLAPAACILSAIGVSEVMTSYFRSFREFSFIPVSLSKKSKEPVKETTAPVEPTPVPVEQTTTTTTTTTTSTNNRKKKKKSKRGKKHPRAVVHEKPSFQPLVKKIVKNTGGRKKKKINSASGLSSSPPIEVSFVMILGLTILFVFYVIHCTWVTSMAYSSPSIVLAAGNGANRRIFDDFREAYYWLSQNTKKDAKIMSWWDYGYQITAMANRTVIVDNNTWNNTHIGTVGKAMASSEPEAYKIMKKLDVDYALVIFGGVTGYSSDDINKFLWMVRIAGSVDSNIKERDYLNRGSYRIDSGGTQTMLNSLMYKMCFYRFGEMRTQYGKATGFDRVRNVEIGKKGFSLTHIEEAYSTEHFLVRIYRVKKENNRS